MKRMKKKQDSNVLDVCTGTGDWALSLANEVGTNGKVTGLDFSKNMLKVAQEKKEQSQLAQLEFIHGNAMDLPFPDNTFDYVTIGFGLRNVPNYETVLKEMFRVVKPGGLVVCLETSQPTMPVFRQIYFFYFRFIMPLFGKIFAKSFEEYTWLHESTKEFPDKKCLEEMFYHTGFSKVKSKSYTFGVAAMHMGIK